jgi:CHASE3 domain sensor protein
VAAIALVGFQNKGDDAWVNHSLSVRSDLLSVLSLVRDAETAQRGYLLAGRSLYLAPYTAAVEELPQRLDHLDALISDNPQQPAAREAEALFPKSRLPVFSLLFTFGEII